MLYAYVLEIAYIMYVLELQIYVIKVFIINCICLSCVSQLFPNPPSSVTQVIIFLRSKMSLHGMSEYTFTVF